MTIRYRHISSTTIAYYIAILVPTYTKSVKKRTKYPTECKLPGTLFGENASIITMSLGPIMTRM